MKLPSTDQLLGKMKSGAELFGETVKTTIPDKISSFFQPTEDVRVRDFLRELPQAPATMQRSIADYFEPVPEDPTKIIPVRTRDIARELPKAPSKVALGALGLALQAPKLIDPRDYYRTPEPGTQLVKPLFQRDPVEVKAPPLQRGVMTMVGLLAETPGLGLLTAAEGIGTLGGLLAGRTPKDQVDLSLGPLDPTFIHQTASEYKTASGLMKEKIQEGRTPWLAALEVGSEKVLDVTIGGLIFRDAARLTLPALGKKEVVTKVAAWDVLGKPATLAQGKKNFRKLLHKFSPDKPGGSEDVTKLINRAMQDMNALGIPTKTEVKKVAGARWLDLLARKEAPITSITSPPGTTRWEQLKQFPKEFMKPDISLQQRLAEPVYISGLLEGGRGTQGQPMGLQIMRHEPTERLTTRVLENVRGRETVSRQFIEDELKRPGVTAAEVRVIRGILDEMPEGKIIVGEFMEKVRGQLLPLTKDDAAYDFRTRQHLPTATERVVQWPQQHLSDSVRGKYTHYGEIIYESPINTTSISTHFNRFATEYPGYFGHVRYDIMAPSYHPSGKAVFRVGEMQSDLFQRRPFEQHVRGSDNMWKRDLPRQRRYPVDRETASAVAHLYETTIKNIDPKTLRLGQEVHYYLGGIVKNFMKVADIIKRNPQILKDNKPIPLTKDLPHPVYEGIPTEQKKHIQQDLEDVLRQYTSRAGGEGSLYGYSKVPSHIIDISKKMKMIDDRPYLKAYVGSVGEKSKQGQVAVELYPDRQQALRRIQDLMALGDFKNTWYQRMARETVRDVAERGHETLLFPTGDTALVIQRLISRELAFPHKVEVKRNTDLWEMEYGYTESLPMTQVVHTSQVKMGDIVAREGAYWAVLHVEGTQIKTRMLDVLLKRYANEKLGRVNLKSSEVIAVRRSESETWRSLEPYYLTRESNEIRQGDFVKFAKKDVDGNTIGDVEIKIATNKFSAHPQASFYVQDKLEKITPGKLTKFIKEDLENIRRLETTMETRAVQSDHPVYTYYEKQLGDYLKKKYNAKIFTDEYGGKWWEIDVPKEAGKRPVEAFGVGAGLEIDDDGNLKVDPAKAVTGALGMGLARRGIGKRPYEPNVTTRVLDQMAGREVVSAQFVRDLVKQPGIKEVERNLITRMLDEHLKKPSDMVKVYRGQSTPELRERMKEGIGMSYTTEKKVADVYGHEGVLLEGYINKEDILRYQDLDTKTKRYIKSIIDENIDDVKVAMNDDHYKPFEELVLEIGEIARIKGKQAIDISSFGVPSESEIRVLSQNIIRSQPITKETVRVPEFIEEVRGQLLPLEVIVTGQLVGSGGFSNVRPEYANVTLKGDERGPVERYFEKVYESPINTGGSSHYPNEKYWSHSRLEDMTDGVTRRVLEIQSDVMQQKKYLRMTGRQTEITADKGNLTSGEWQEYQTYSRKYAEGTITDSESVRWKELTEKRGMDDIRKKHAEIGETIRQMFEPYKNTWYQRQIREEIRDAAVAGKDILQFPTGKTAMKIEGITGEMGEITEATYPIIQEYIKRQRTGQVEIKILGGDKREFEIIEGPNIHGTMVVVAEDVGIPFMGVQLERMLQMFDLDGVKYVTKTKQGKRIVQAKMTERHEDRFSDSIFDDAEMLNMPPGVTEGIDTHHTVYKFYEQQVGKYLTKSWGAKRINDKQGVEWWEISVPKQTKDKPIEAFGVVAGVEIDDEGDIYISPEKALFGVMAAGFARRKFSLSKRRQDLADRYRIDGEMMRAALDAQRRGTIPFAQTVRNAEEITASIREVANMKPGAILNAEQVESNWQVIRGTKTEYTKMKANIVADPTNTALQKKHDELGGLITQAIINTEAAGASEAGRVLAATQGSSEVEKQSALAARNINNLRKELDPAELEQFEKKLFNLDLENPEEVAKFIHMFSKSTFTDKVVEYYKSSLLSALTTQGFNFTSSLIMAEMNIPVRATAGAFDALKSAVKGTPREVYAMEALRLQLGYIANLRKATLEASRAMTREFYQGGPRSLLKEQKRPSPAIKGTTGAVIRTPFRVMHMIDTFERTMVVNSEIDAMAYRMAKQEGFKGIEREERIAEIKLSPPTDLYETAVKKGERVLFFEDLRGMLQGVNKLRHKMPVLGLVIPFFRSIINAGLVEAWRLTPGRAITDPIVRRQVAKKRPIKVGGAFEGGQDPLMANPLTRPEEIGRMIFGTGLALSMMIAITAGRIEITGAAPTDPKERETFYGMGKKPYHFRIKLSEGNYTRWIEYRRLQPLGTMLFTTNKTMEMKDLFQRGDLTEDQVTDAMQNAITATIRFVVTDQAAMQGVSQLLEALEGGKYSTGVWHAGNRYLQNFLGGFIPNLSFSAARSIDETIYFTEGFGDEFRKRIPFATEGLIPRRNIFGEEIGRGESALSRFLGPYRHSLPTNDPIFQELDRIEYGVSLPQRTVYNQRLSLEEYDIYLQYAGQRLRQELERVMNTTGYQSADIMVKKEIVDNVASAVREEARVKLFPHWKRVYDLERSLIMKGYTPKEARDTAMSRYGMDERQSALQAEAILNRTESGDTRGRLPSLEELTR